MKIIQLLSVMGLTIGIGCAASVQPDLSVIGERGNWLKKRAWVKEAQAVQEQLLKDSVAVKKSRTQFITAFETIDKKVNEFYSIKGFTRGKLGTLITDIKADIALDTERRIAQAKQRSESDDAPINFYDVQVEAIEQEVKRFERDFEQFNLDMKSIADLDVSLQDRIKTVDKQIKDSANLVSQSSKKLDEMWWIIDDQKAADAFYVIQEFGDKVAAIKKYLEETLFVDFKKVIATLEKQIEQVNKQIERIEERGFIVAHRTQRLKQKEVGDVLAVVSEELTSQNEQAPVKPRRRTASKKQEWYDGWFALPQQMYGYIQEFVSASWSFISSVFGLQKKVVRARRRVADLE
jgi:hypothetical protein